MAFATSQSIDQLLTRGLSFRLPNNAPISSLYTLYANGAGMTYWSNSMNPRDLSTLSSAIGEVGSTVIFQQTEINDLYGEVSTLSTTIFNTSNGIMSYVNSTIAGISTFSTFYNDLASLSNVVEIGLSTLSTAITVTNSTSSAFLRSTLTSSFTAALLSSSTGLYNYTNRVSSATVYTTTFNSTTAGLNRAILSTGGGLGSNIAATNLALSTNISTLRWQSFSTNVNFFSTISGYGPRIGRLETASTGISTFTNNTASTLIAASQSTQDSFLNARFTQLSTYVSTIAVFATAQFGSLSSLSSALYTSISTISAVDAEQNAAISSLSRNLSILTTSSILAGVYDTFTQLEAYTLQLIGSTITTMQYWQSSLYYSTIIQNVAISDAYFSTFTGSAYQSTVSATTALVNSYVSTYTSTAVGVQYSTNTVFINNLNSTTIGTLYSTGYSYLLSTLSETDVGIPLNSTVVFIGSNAGKIAQDVFAVAIGFNAGESNQGPSAIAIGLNAGSSNQDLNGISIGENAGADSQASQSIAIGQNAGQSNQGILAIAIGFQAGQLSQRENAVAVGLSAGASNQGSNSIGIGIQAGTQNQGVDCIAIGKQSGGSGQESNAVAIGTYAGYLHQSSYAIAVGDVAGRDNQGSNAIAIGQGAGYISQGLNAIAIGQGAGSNYQPANSIILNASNVGLDAFTEGFFVNPVRSNAAITDGFLHYDIATNELVYNDVGGSSGIGELSTFVYPVYLSTINTLGDLYINATSVGGGGNIFDSATQLSYVGPSALDTNADGSKVLSAETTFVVGVLALSTDYGNTFTTIDNAGVGYIKAIFGDSPTDQIILALQNGTQYLRLSTDGGTTFNDITSIPQKNYLYCATSRGGINILAALASTGELYVSSNNGTSWSLVNTLSPTGFTGFVMSSDGTKMVVTTTTNVRYSSTGGTGFTTTLTTTGILGVTASADFTKLILLKNGSFEISIDGGQTFISTETYAGSSNYNGAVSYDGTIQLVSDYGNGLCYASIDSGFSWNTVLSGIGGFTVAMNGSGTIAYTMNGMANLFRTPGDTFFNPYKIGINTSTPLATLDINGNLAFSTINVSSFKVQLTTEEGVIAIGQSTGVDQDDSAIAIGNYAGSSNQSTYSIALGRYAGGESQSLASVAIGFGAGRISQGERSVAIGDAAGNGLQGNFSIAIGESAAYNAQGNSNIAIGIYAAEQDQQDNSIAIGNQAASNAQQSYAVAIGYMAGVETQGMSAIAVGNSAGILNQGSNSIAIGQQAGAVSQGSNTIAIGFGAGSNAQVANSIILNASNAVLNATTNAGFYVNPVRSNAAIPGNVVHYDTATKELVYNDSVNVTRAVASTLSVSTIGINTSDPLYALDIVGSSRVSRSTIANVARFNVMNVSTVGGFSPITFTDGAVFPGNAIITSQTNSIVNFTWQPVESNRTWYGIASSSDGVKLVAVVNGGQIYTSTDSGATWTARDSVRDWISVASSADGTKLVAVVQNGFVYTSTNSGVTWTQRFAAANWRAVACSSNGTNIIAVVQDDKIYTSSDSGVNWIARDNAFTRTYYGAASSADGTKLVVVVNSGGQIYTSANSGVSWTARESNRDWTSVASSADGSKLVAGAYGGQLYTSTDSGVNWTARDSNRNWIAVASSSDGTNLVAAVQGGQIYRSTDSGVSWSPSESNRGWSAITSSSDGTKLAAANGILGPGQIYVTSITTTTTTTSFLGINTLTPLYNLDVAGAARASTVFTSSIGIGTTAPTAILDVRGNIFASSITTSSIVVRNNVELNYLGRTAITAQNGCNAFIFNAPGDGAISYLQAASNIYFTTVLSGTAFAMIGTAGTYAGRVGIGTTTPAYALDVNGDARVSSFLYNQQLYTNAIQPTGIFHVINGYDAAGTNWGYSQWFYGRTTGGGVLASTMQLYTYAGGTTCNSLNISPIGNVGIGTRQTVPAYPLDVFSSSNNFTARIQNSNTGGSAGGLYIQKTLGGASGLYVDVTGSYGACATFVGGSNRMLGNLQMGSPNGNLFTGAGTPLNPTLLIQFADDGNGYIRNMSTSGALFLGASNANTITITSNQNVGIVNTFPLYKLDVVGNMGITSTISFTNANPGDMVSSDQGAANRYGMGLYLNGTTRLFAASTFTGASVRLSFPTNGDKSIYGTFFDALTVLQPGRVGIGTTTPSQLLELFTAGTSVSTIINIIGGNGTSSSNKSGIQLRTTTGGGATFTHSMVSEYSGANYGISFRNSNINAGSSVLRLDMDNSRVGIGTLNPAVQLDLSTDGARKLTTTTWTTGSDERIKENIVPADLNICLSTIYALPLRYYEWRESYANSSIQKDRHNLGFIAQEVIKIFPKSVNITPFEHNLSNFHSLNVDQIYKANIGATQRLAQLADASSNFIGTHRCYSADPLTSNIGKIVIANGEHAGRINNTPVRGISSITAQGAQPLVSLASSAKDKRVFGILGSQTNDGRAVVNSVGEGALWVCEANGPIVNGDYITSSDVGGYGMKQGEEYIANYTVAKATMDCDFTAPLMPKLVAGTAADGSLSWVPCGSLEPAYALRYVTPDGTELTHAEYTATIARGDIAYRAAFIGCTYHCG